jgi:hypothetical protein
MEGRRGELSLAAFLFFLVYLRFSVPSVSLWFTSSLRSEQV